MTRSQFKKRKLAGLIQQLLRRPLFRASLGLGGLLPMAALANPSGGQVVGGTATINAPDPDHTVIDQQSQQAIINWQQFSIGSQQYVQFRQPNSTAVVLNRVVGGDPTNILGSLKANGQVFLVNPNGVFFGAGASLDVQGLMATTQGISNSDFMAGHYVFAKGTNAPDGSVTNAGTITAKPGGYVVLAGDYAANTGVITAQAGHVVLASGTQTTLTLSGNSLVDFAVNRATLSSLAGVSNAGKISADGGLVVMTADVANQLKATVVNNTGLVEAHSITSHNGTVVLSATGGNITNSGTLDASATQPGVSGGSIVVKGNAATDLISTSKVLAQGDSAKGGLVEISGHSLKLRGVVKVGSRGTVIIDPTKISITTGSTAPSSTGATTYQVGVGYIETQLNSGNNVVLVASSSIAHAAGVTSLSATGTGNLTLKTGTLTTATTGASLGPSGFQCWADGVCLSQTSGAGATFTPGNGTISLTGMSINIKGAFNANAGTGTVNTGNVTASAGVTIQGGTVTVGNITAAAGNVTLNASTGQATLQSVKTAKGNIHVNGNGVTVTGTLSAGASGTGGSVSIAAGTGAASLNNVKARTNLNITATGVTGTGLLSANALTVSAGTGSIDFSNAQLTLGNGVNPNATGDTTVTNLLASVNLAPSSLVPNSVLTAGPGQPIKLGTLNFTGSYLQLNADALSFNGPVTVPAASVVQMAPVSTTSAISVEQTLATSAPVNFGVTSQLSLFPTVVIGSGKESGNVTIGQNGPLSLNATNLFIVTTGSVSGLTSVQTSGIVGDLTTIIYSGPVVSGPDFQPPTAQEVGGTGTNINATDSQYSQNYQITGLQASQHIYPSPFDAPCLTVVASGNQGYTCAPSKSGYTPG